MKSAKLQNNIPITSLSQLLTQNQSSLSLNVGLLGCGEVGGNVYYALNVLGLLPGAQITRICVQDKGKLRAGTAAGCQVELSIPAGLFCEAEEIVNDPEIDVIVDATAADTVEILIAAMLAGKHVATANKALVAKRGAKLEATAAYAGVGFLCEGCVQGKVPVLRAAKYHLKPYFMAALLSGTCGYILSEVEKDPAKTIAQTLVRAQELKYAEADPTSDVEAFDATAKAKILARAYFGAPTLSDSVDSSILRIGILDIPNFTFRFAAAYQHRVQLVGTIEKTAEGKIGIVVMPALVPKKSFIGSLFGVENGLEIHEQLGNPSEYAGPGAGGPATAAAILGDLATIVESMRGSIPPVIFPRLNDEIVVAPFDEINIRPVFLSSSPENEPGIFRAKLAVIESHDLSVEQIENDALGQSSGDSYDAIVCKSASVSKVRKVKSALESLPCVHSKVSLLRVLGSQPFGC